jgi:PAS domain S-box-containing protein
MEPQQTPQRAGDHSTLKEAARQFVRRKHAEEALAESQAWKAAVLEAALDCIITIDQEGNVVEWNPAAEETFGHSRAAALGKLLSDLILPPSVRETHGYGLRAFLGDPESPVFGKRSEMPALRADGTVFPVELAVVPIGCPGKLLFTLYLRDVAERKLAEEEARRQREWLQVTLSSIGDAVMTTDPHGKISFMNPVAEALTGWTPEEAAGRPLGEVFRISSDGVEEPADSSVTAALREGGIRSLPRHTMLTSKGGTQKPIDDCATPIRDHTGETHGVVVVFHDVTERRQIEGELRERAQKLVDAHRRKDEFMAMLAHELRNPLAPVRNALHILRIAAGDPEKVDQVREIMERQVQHLVRLVDDLLDVSRITRGKISLRCKRLDWARLIRTRIEDRRSTLDASGLDLTLDVPETPVWTTADPTRLAQILDNLLDNAMKFTGRPGHLTVRLAAPPEEKNAVLTVSDTGIGIEPELLSRLFEPFVQADHSLDRSRGGLGLGLALVKGIAEMHGGTAKAESEGTNRGSTFTVRLPRRREPAALAQKPVLSLPAAVKPRHVLVVEDNRDAADSLRLLLEVSGYEVTVAYSGPMGLEAATRELPDVVICDIGLPGLDGFGVARALRQNPGTRAARLIAVTGYGQPADRERALEAGFDEHLVKPVDPETLLGRIAV